jgi:hypothetical protein
VIRQVALLEVEKAADAHACARLEHALRDAAPKLPGLVRSQLGRHLPGAVGGSAYTWDAWLEERAPMLEAWLSAEPLRSALAAAGARVDAVRFRPQQGHVAERGIRQPIKRTLLLRVFPQTPPGVIARFDADMCRMPDHIRAIRNWAYSRPDPALHSTSWTHVWEQEYAQLEGLQLDYMLHPYHWAYIDRYYDVESGHQIVDPRLAHVFYRAEGDGTILG